MPSQKLFLSKINCILRKKEFCNFEEYLPLGYFSRAKRLHWLIIFVSYCSLKPENLVERDCPFRVVAIS